MEGVKENKKVATIMIWSVVPSGNNCCKLNETQQKP